MGVMYAHARAMYTRPAAFPLPCGLESRLGLTAISAQILCFSNLFRRSISIEKLKILQLLHRIKTAFVLTLNLSSASHVYNYCTSIQQPSASGAVRVRANRSRTSAAAREQDFN